MSAFCSVKEGNVSEPFACKYDTSSEAIFVGSGLKNPGKAAEWSSCASSRPLRNCRVRASPPKRRVGLTVDVASSHVAVLVAVMLVALVAVLSVGAAGCSGRVEVR